MNDADRGARARRAWSDGYHAGKREMQAAIDAAQARAERADAELTQARRALEAVAHFWRNDPLAFGDDATPTTLAVRFAVIAQLCVDTLEHTPGAAEKG